MDGHQNSPLTTWSALAWISTVWWCSKNNFLSSIPSLNLLKIHSNSYLPPPNLVRACTCSKMLILTVLNMEAYQANHDIRVLFVICIELKRSRISPCLCVDSFCSRSPSGISFRLNSVTFLRFSMASLGLLCASSQRGDSGRNLRLAIQ